MKLHNGLVSRLGIYLLFSIIILIIFSGVVFAREMYPRNDIEAYKIIIGTNCIAKHDICSKKETTMPCKNICGITSKIDQYKQTSDYQVKYIADNKYDVIQSIKENYNQPNIVCKKTKVYSKVREPVMMIHDCQDNIRQKNYNKDSSVRLKNPDTREELTMNLEISYWN